MHTALHTAIAFIAFALLHSLAVSRRFKAIAAAVLGEALMKAFYRLGFTVFSVITLAAALWHVSTLPDRTLYSAPLYLAIPARAVQLAGVVLLLAAFRPFDSGYFLGMRQAVHYLRTGKAEGDAEGMPSAGLVKTGAYGLVRHPMYLAGIIIFAFDPLVTVKSLTIRALAVLYLIWGMYIEDRRLLADYGEEFREYRRRFGGPMRLFRTKRST